MWPPVCEEAPALPSVDAPARRVNDIKGSAEHWQLLRCAPSRRVNHPTVQVSARNIGFTCGQHAITAADLPKVRTTSPTTAHFQRFLARWSAVWAPAFVTRSLHTVDRRELHYMRVQHADDGPPHSFVSCKPPHDRRRGERVRITPGPMWIGWLDADRLSACG